MKIFAHIAVAFLLLTPLLTLTAQSTQGRQPDNSTQGRKPAVPYSQQIEFANPFKGASDLKGLIEKIIKDILFPIGGVIAVVMIMYAGFTYVTAGGDMNKIKTATDMLLYTSIGAAILLGAWVIVQAIDTTIKQLQ